MKIKSKKTILLSSILIGFSAFSYANEFNIIISKEQNSYNSGKISEPNYSKWYDIGSPYNCIERYNPADYKLDEVFTQIEDCDQKQERTVTVIEIVEGNTNETVTKENQIVKVENSYSETGTGNYKTGETNEVYGNWTDVNGHYNCEAWTPTPAEVYHGTSYTQNRNCSQNQTRVKTTYDIWADGSETLATTENESQVISEVEAQGAVGTYLAKSCKEILNTQGSTGSKAYTIHLDNTVRTVYCDMVTDGGGWTIVADQNLYVEGYPTAGGLPDDNPNNTQNTRLTRWPKYSEYAVKSVINLHGAPYDASVAPEFRKFNTGAFGEVEVDMISFLLDKSNYQNGRAKNEYVMFNGVPWGDSHSDVNYYGYRWFNKNDMTYNHWGQSDVWGHIANSNLFRIASTVTGYARTAHCGAGWAANDCRLALTAWVNRSIIKQKAVFMVR